MSSTYNPPWKGDLTRGFWDCGHWYDFPERVLEAQRLQQRVKEAQDLDTALKETKAVVNRIKPDPRLPGHRQMGGAPIFVPEVWERIKEQEIMSSLFPSYEGTTTVSAEKTKPLTLADIKGMHNKLLAAGLLTNMPVTFNPPPHLDVTFFNNTGMRLYWNKSLPRHGVTLILRTIGGVPVIGQWTGEYGQFFDAWAELPQEEPTTLKGATND